MTDNLIRMSRRSVSKNLRANRSSALREPVEQARELSERQEADVIIMSAECADEDDQAFYKRIWAEEEDRRLCKRECSVK